MTILKSEQNPVIVMGMHRSGTTLLSRVLQELNVYMGADLYRKTLESFSFMRLNDSLLHMANANWHETFSMWEALNDDRRVGLLTSKMRKQLSKGVLADYWRDNNSSNSIWGWKDPRNTLTLPIWHRIFPDAKIIYIIRNGIDVAFSLVKRSQKQSELRIGNIFKNGLVQLLSKYRSENRQYRTDQKLSMTMEEAFHLWAEYLSFADFNTRKINDEKILRLRYEDMLLEPLSSLRLIADFIGKKTDDTVLVEIAKVINDNRRFAFVMNPKLRDFYESHRKHPEMVKHSYDQLLNQQAKSIIS